MTEAPEQQMKDALRMHAAGVALVSAQTSSGPVGITISSLGSVAVEPRVLMFSFTHHSGAAGAVLDARAFVVNLLRDRNVDVARDFGNPAGVRLGDGAQWSHLPGGEPYLPFAGWAIRCSHRDRIEVGESRIVVADVLEIVRCTPGSPLVYCDRQFHTLTELDILPEPRSTTSRREGDS